VTATDTSSTVAHRYVDYINPGRFGEVCDLFAPSGVFNNPYGQRLEGAEAIRQFLLPHLERQQARLRIARATAQGSQCWAELEVQDPASGEYTLVSANHFTVDGEGRITELRVFVRPTPQNS
jgi:hypothetical protein